MPALTRIRPRAAWIIPLMCLLLWVEAPRWNLRVEGDGYYHYLYLVTVFEDGDLDFVNQYRRHGHPYFNPQGPVWGNPFPPGCALLWLPTYALTHAYTLYKGQPVDPFAPRFQARALSGTLIAGLLTLFLAYRLLRKRYDPPWALLAVGGAAFATPYLFYLAHSPSYAHVPTAFFLTLFLYFWLEHPRALVLMGVVAGLAALTKHQVGLLVPIVFMYLLAGLRDWKGALRFGAAAFLTLLPLLFYWYSAFGKWLTVPQGGGYMTANFSGVAHSLWSVRHGALVWSPILYAALAGLIALVLRKDGRLRLMLLFFGMTVVVNGLPMDWWGGDGFGNRRWVDLFPFLALGLAHALQGTAAWVERRPRRAAMAVLGGAVLGLCLLNWGMYNGYKRGWLDPGAYRDATEVYGPGLRTLYAIFGNPLSYPDSLPFALRYGVHPRVYDEIVGSALNMDLRSDGPVLDPADPRTRKYFYQGFRYDPRPVIAGAEARIFLPQLSRHSLSIVLLMERNGGPVPVEVRMNGARVGGGGRYSWQEPIGLTILAEHMRIGTNVLSLHFASPGEVEFGLLWQHPNYPYFIKILPFGVLDGVRLFPDTGQVEVVGWAVGRKVAPEVSLVRYPERTEILPEARFPREDVARAHPKGAGMDRAGFTFRYDPGSPVKDRVTLVLKIAEPGGWTNWYIRTLPLEADGGR